MFSFPEQYGGTLKEIKVTTEFLKEVSTQSQLSINTRSTIYGITDEVPKKLWMLSPRSRRKSLKWGNWSISALEI